MEEGFCCHIKGSSPKYQKSRPVSYSMLSKVEHEYDKLVKMLIMIRGLHQWFMCNKAMWKCWYVVTTISQPSFHKPANVVVEAITKQKIVGTKTPHTANMENEGTFNEQSGGKSPYSDSRVTQTSNTRYMGDGVTVSDTAANCAICGQC